MADTSEDDPRGLILEAYRIEGITPAECRSIFLDWALSLPEGQEAAPAAERLLALHGQDAHPMNAVLRAAREASHGPRRKGGRQARMDKAKGPEA